MLDDATKIIGCYKALLKSDFATDTAGDPAPVRRAIAFARSIEASKLVQAEFAEVARDWRAAVEAGADALPPLDCQVLHVDGTFNAKSRDARLSWLKEETGRADECRILTNARCLSEGVDVPALDAVMFLHPRKSQIDVVQAVGRVMRQAKDKRMGYVILPVGVPAGVDPVEARTRRTGSPAAHRPPPPMMSQQVARTGINHRSRLSLRSNCLAQRRDDSR